MIEVFINLFIFHLVTADVFAQRIPSKMMRVIVFSVIFILTFFGQIFYQCKCKVLAL